MRQVPRSMAPRKPQSKAYFTPRTSSPAHEKEPERAVDQRLHEEKAADSMAGFVDEPGSRAMRPYPTSRITRLRNSSRCSSMKITRTIASASSPRPSIRGLRKALMPHGPNRGSRLDEDRSWLHGGLGVFLVGMSRVRGRHAWEPLNSVLISSTILARRLEPPTSVLRDLTLALTVSVCSGGSQELEISP